MTGLSYSSVDFSLIGATIHRIDAYSAAPRQLQLEELAEQDGSVLVGSRIPGKTITVEGELRADTKAGLEDAIDVLHGLCGGQSLETLDLDHGGTIRRYQAIASSVVVSRERHGVTQAGFSIQFIVPSGYGTDVSTTILFSGGISAAQGVLSSVVGGSYKAQPDITLTFVSVDTDDLEKAVRIGNAANGLALSISRVWQPNDVLTLNSSTRRVYVNAAEVRSTGYFPYWEPGTARFEYSDDFVSRNVSIIGTYVKRWR